MYKMTTPEKSTIREDNAVVDEVAATAIPGTVHLVSGGEDHEVLLVPTPSNDPNDPLNWSQKRKIFNVLVVYFYVFATGVAGTSVYSVLTPISKDTGLTIDQLNRGTGFLFLLAGWGNLIWQPSAMLFGRRPVFLLSILGCAAMSEWAAHISRYGEWAACRCLFGLMVAPVELLPQVCISELFFAHERGAYGGIYMLCLATSNFIAPLIAGFINSAFGWRWVQHWTALLLLLNFVLTLFFYEDTAYDRGTVEAEKESWYTLDSPPTLDTVRYPPKSYLQRLKPWTISRDCSIKRFLEIALRPIYLLFSFPAVAWCGLFYGLALAWFNVYNATASVILSAAPYNFSSSMVGLSYVAPTIGALVGGYYAGPIADIFVLRLARRNKGVREPEQRLWGLSAFCLFMPAGLILWGVGAAHSVHWAGLLLGAAFLAACNVMGGAFSLAYCVDSYKDLAAETLMGLMFLRNTLSFGFNYAITPWISHSGLQNTFITVGMIALTTGLTFLLVIWKGKSWRRWTATRYWRFCSVPNGSSTYE
ncbi:protein Hol1p [Trichomonascus vanleenenianus]|uniref:protein Hol1p n=1 Tax=Trichomonascus vanleenenianus TaxID=2268995 RepID=UPI003EC96D1F